MKTLSEWHHALYVKGTEDATHVLKRMIQEAQYPTLQNPDFTIYNTTTFGVDDARVLARAVSLKPLQEDRRVSVITATLITPEAQNALLKTLEEPSAHAVTIFVLPQPERLLGTLRSRMQELSIDALENEEGKRAAHTFLTSNESERLKIVQALNEKGDNDERDVSAISEFLDALETRLATRVKEETVREGLRAVYRAKRIVSESSASVKPLLEQLAYLV